MKLEKEQIRQTLRDKVREISPARRLELSAAACALLTKQSAWQEAGSILFYAPLSDELDLWPLVAVALAADKTVVLPKYVPDSQHYVGCRVLDLGADLTTGKFGIREPRSHCGEILLNHLDLALVPGVGFDLKGRRLGRGKGFYDRLLAQISGTKCGVGFDEQIVEAIPTEPHDVHLNYISTPTRWLKVAIDARF